MKKGENKAMVTGDWPRGKAGRAARWRRAAGCVASLALLASAAGCGGAVDLRSLMDKGLALVNGYEIAGPGQAGGADDGRSGAQGAQGAQGARSAGGPDAQDLDRTVTPVPGARIRLGAPAQALPQGYSYIHTDNATGEAALADSCDPIAYAVAAGASEREAALVDEAVGTISTYTGLRFQKVGQVSDSLADGGSGDDPTQTSFLYSFLDATQYPNFADGAANADGSVDRTLGETDSRSVTGVAVGADDSTMPFIYYASIALNQRYFGDQGDAWTNVNAAAEVIEHETAHALGLDHTENPGSFMTPYADDYVGITDADAQALRALVRQCLA